MEEIQCEASSDTTIGFKFSNVPCVPTKTKFGDIQLMNKNFSLRTNRGDLIKAKLQIIFEGHGTICDRREWNYSASKYYSYIFVLFVNDLKEMSSINVHFGGNENTKPLHSLEFENVMSCKKRLDNPEFYSSSSSDSEGGYKRNPETYRGFAQIEKLGFGRKGVKWRSKEQSSKISKTMKNVKWISGEINLVLNAPKTLINLDKIDDFLFLLKSPIGSTDFKIKILESNENEVEEDEKKMLKLKTFDFHKELLCKASFEFQIMLESSWTVESKTNVLKLTDVASSTIKMFHDFLYNERISKTIRNFNSDMLMFAHKYNISPIYKITKLILKEKLDKSNMFEIFKVANILASFDDDLIKYVVDFINQEKLIMCQRLSPKVVLHFCDPNDYTFGNYQLNCGCFLCDSCAVNEDIDNSDEEEENVEDIDITVEDDTFYCGFHRKRVKKSILIQLQWPDPENKNEEIVKIIHNAKYYHEEEEYKFWI